MPILQSRLCALIEVADEVIRNRERMKEAAEQRRELAIDAFYAADGNSNPLATTMLAHLQELVSILSEPPLGYTAIETLAREREHFRLKAAHNDAAARAMRRKREGREWRE